MGEVAPGFWQFAGISVPSDSRPSMPGPLAGRAQTRPARSRERASRVTRQLGPGGQHGRQAGDAGTADAGSGARGVRQQRPRRQGGRRTATLLHDPWARPVRRDRVGVARRAHPGQERARVRAARRRVPDVLVADRDEHRRAEVLPRPHGVARARALGQADDRPGRRHDHRLGPGSAATSRPRRTPTRSTPS